jgi:hypothetical protein
MNTEEDLIQYGSQTQHAVVQGPDWTVRIVNGRITILGEFPELYIQHLLVHQLPFTYEQTQVGRFVDLRYTVRTDSLNVLLHLADLDVSKKIELVIWTNVSVLNMTNIPYPVRYGDFDNPLLILKETGGAHTFNHLQQLETWLIELLPTEGKDMRIYCENAVVYWGPGYMSIRKWNPVRLIRRARELRYDLTLEEVRLYLEDGLYQVETDTAMALFELDLEGVDRIVWTDADLPLHLPLTHPIYFLEYGVVATPGATTWLVEVLEDTQIHTQTLRKLRTWISTRAPHIRLWIDEELEGEMWNWVVDFHINMTLLRTDLSPLVTREKTDESEIHTWYIRRTDTMETDRIITPRGLLLLEPMEEMDEGVNPLLFLEMYRQEYEIPVMYSSHGRTKAPKFYCAIDAIHQPIIYLGKSHVVDILHRTRTHLPRELSVKIARYLE